MLNQIFKALWIKHPLTGELDPVLTLSAFVVFICGVKFLLDGVSLTIAEHTLTLGHVDPLSYGSLLAPILGMHGWVSTRAKKDDDKE